MQSQQPVQKRFVATQAEIEQYAMCPEVRFRGAHLGGFNSCVFCCQILRRYRKKQNEEELIKPVEEATQDQDPNEEIQTEQNLAHEMHKLQANLLQMDDEDCTKPMCMKLGWCVCK